MEHFAAGRQVYFPPRLKRRDRWIVRVGELTAGEIALIAAAEVPAEHAHLDDELKDWRP